MGWVGKNLAEVRLDVETSTLTLVFIEATSINAALGFKANSLSRTAESDPTGIAKMTRPISVPGSLLTRSRANDWALGSVSTISTDSPFATAASPIEVPMRPHPTMRICERVTMGPY